MQRCNTAMTIEAALAHCQRDAKGLLKLGGLWLNAELAHDSLSKLVRRHSLEVTNVKGYTKKRGLYAHESVARKLAQLIPAQHLWRDGGSETNGEPVGAPATNSTNSDGVVAAIRTEPQAIQPAPAVLSEAVAHPNPATNSAGVLVELGALLQCDVTQMRSAGRILSVIDVAMAITGLARDQASKAVRTLLCEHPEVRSKISNLKFPGRGQRETPGAEIETIIEIIMLLPGAAAATTRQQAARLLRRFIGADQSIIDELQVMRAAQRQLQAIPEDLRSPAQILAAACGEAVQQADIVSQLVIFHLPPPPIIMESCPTGCLDDGPPHFYILRIPSQPGAPEDGDTYRGGRTKDFDARMLKHHAKYGEGSYMALCAPNYGHVEQLWHRHIRPQSISQKHNEEQILAAKVDLSQVPGFVLELHTKRQTELQLENISQVSRKRTREEAEDEHVIAEIDAKRDLAEAKRDLAVAELGAKREFARDREQLSTDRERLMLRLAAEGNADAIKALFAPKP